MEDEEGKEIPIPVDYNGANPNGVEFDNLYLDMNGIVHPCTHPEGKPAPETEEEMMVEVFKYTERVVNMVRPRRLLFMAIGIYLNCMLSHQLTVSYRRRSPSCKDEPTALATISSISRGKRERGSAQRGC